MGDTMSDANNLARAQLLLNELSRQRNDALNRVAELAVDLAASQAAHAGMDSIIKERDARIAELERAVAALVAAQADRDAAGALTVEAPDTTDLGSI